MQRIMPIIGLVLTLTACDATAPEELATVPERSPTPGYQENRRNAKAVSTPGAANAREAISQRFGTLPRNKLLQPAIEVAEETTSTSKQASLTADPRSTGRSRARDPHPNPRQRSWVDDRVRRERRADPVYRWLGSARDWAG